MKLRYKAIALKQLREIETYVSLRNPAAAARVMQAIERAVLGLLDHPYAHRTRSRS